jgi:hypothetical protein
LIVGGALVACSKKISDADSERCNTFADRIASCALASEQLGPLPEPDRTNVRTIAYDVCTGTTDDPTAIKWYGDVAAKSECAKLPGKCRAFQDCMDAIDARGSGSQQPR